MTLIVLFMKSFNLRIFFQFQEQFSEALISYKLLPLYLKALTQSTQREELDLSQMFQMCLAIVVLF